MGIDNFPRERYNQTMQKADAKRAPLQSMTKKEDVQMQKMLIFFAKAQAGGAAR
jgi:hypothetical protein